MNRCNTTIFAYISHTAQKPRYSITYIEGYQEDLKI